MKSLTKLRERYGWLLVIGEPFLMLPKPDSKFRKSYVNVECICGKTKIIPENFLKSGRVNSCGCYNQLVASLGNRTHGLSHKHPLHSIWSVMKRRCYNKNINQFEYWGGRGIAVCDEWKKNFPSFLEWALSNGWKKGLQLDRYPNKDGNYEPGNCRFVTSKINNRNKRNVKLTQQRADHIRLLYKTSMKVERIKFLYGINSGTISHIVNNRQWVKPKDILAKVVCEPEKA